MTAKNGFVYDLIFDRICRVALRGEKDVCLETAEGRLFVEQMGVFSDNYEDLPECDSFDWKRKPAEPVQETKGKTYVYIFEDGTVQRHSRRPTLDDRNAIDQGLLIVLTSDSEIRYVDSDLTELILETCLLDETTLAACHVQVQK